MSSTPSAAATMSSPMASAAMEVAGDSRAVPVPGVVTPRSAAAMKAAPATTASPWNATLVVGLLLALGTAVGYSGKAIIIKVAYRYGVDAVTLLMYRMLFALPLFALVAWWSGRGKPPLARRDWAILAGLGFTGYYLCSLLDFMGLQYVTASFERLVLYLNPTLVLLLGIVVHRKRSTARQWLAMAVSYAGMLMVFGQELHLEGPHVTLGALLVFGSAVCFAAYLFASGEVVKRIGAMRLIGTASTIACLLCIGHFLVTRPLSAAAVHTDVLWLSLLNATACTVAPGLMLMAAIERIGATLTSQTAMLGPLSTIGLGVLILGEPFTPWVAAGTLAVLLGIWLLARWR